MIEAQLRPGYAHFFRPLLLRKALRLSHYSSLSVRWRTLSRSYSAIEIRIPTGHACPSRALTSGVGAIRVTSESDSGLRQCTAKKPASVTHGSLVPAPRITLSLIASALRIFVGPHLGTITGNPRS